MLSSGFMKYNILYIIHNLNEYICVFVGCIYIYLWDNIVKQSDKNDKFILTFKPTLVE